MIIPSYLYRRDEDVFDCNAKAMELMSKCMQPRFAEDVFRIRTRDDLDSFMRVCGLRLSRCETKSGKQGHDNRGLYPTRLARIKPKRTSRTVDDEQRGEQDYMIDKVLREKRGRKRANKYIDYSAKYREQRQLAEDTARYGGATGKRPSRMRKRGAALALENALDDHLPPKKRRRVLCKSDPAPHLGDALATPIVTHRAAILDPDKFGQLLRDIDQFTGTPLVRIRFSTAVLVVLDD